MMQAFPDAFAHFGESQGIDWLETVVLDLFPDLDRKGYSGAVASGHLRPFAEKGLCGRWGKVVVGRILLVHIYG